MFHDALECKVIYMQKWLRPWPFRSQRNSKKAQLSTSHDSHINYKFQRKPVCSECRQLKLSLSDLTPSILIGGCRPRNKGGRVLSNFLALSQFLAPRTCGSRLSKTKEGGTFPGSATAMACEEESVIFVKVKVLFNNFILISK